MPKTILLHVDREVVARSRAVDVLAGERIAIRGRERLRRQSACRHRRASSRYCTTAAASGPPAFACDISVMPCGPSVFWIPGRAAMNAFTASSCPIIAAEKIVGRAPWRQQEVGDRLVADMRGGVDAGFPVAEAPVDRRARHRRLLLDELADAREVAVRRADGFLDERRDPAAGNASAADDRGRRGGAWPQALVAERGDAERGKTEVTEKNERRDSGMDVTSGARYRKAAPFRTSQIEFRTVSRCGSVS